MKEYQIYIGIAAGILTAISAIPQIVKAFQTKKVDHVSPVMFIILALGNALWAYYGILLKDWPIIITNAFSFTMDILMLVLKMVYGRK